jgi:hypothetical protein
MGQKTHPVAIRLNQNRTFDSSWYSDSYASFLKDDFLIRKAITSFFGILKFSFNDFSLGRVFYQKSAQKLILSIFFYKKKNTDKNFRYRLFIRYCKKNRKALSTFAQKSFIDPKWSNLNLKIGHSDLSNNINNPTKTSLKVLSGALKKKHTLLLSNKWTLFQELFSKSSLEKDLISFFKFSKSNKTWLQPTQPKKLETKLTTSKTVLNFRKSPIKKSNIIYTTNSLYQNYYLNAATDNMIPFHFFVRYLSKQFPKKQNLLEKKFQISNSGLTENKSNKQMFFFGSQQGQFKESRLNEKSGTAAFFHKKASHPFLAHFENSLSSLLGYNVYIYPIKSTIATQSACFLADKIVNALQKDQKERTWKILKTVLQDCLFLKKCLGIRILCSGRLAGVEIARKYSFKKGQTSLNVFSQKIDFIQRTALTKFGIIGVKVWISYDSNN